MKWITFFIGLFAMINSFGAQNETTAVATFAGGCFWCEQSAFDRLEGVISTTVGYTGGEIPNPTYAQVSAGGTGHRESLEVVYDPQKVSYQQLLNIFWHNVDPTDEGGQFCDRGEQYTSAIFYHTEEQKQLAEASKEELLKSGKFKTIATAILPATTFYPAEEYHQEYHEKNPIRYNFYRKSCGRDRRLKEVWGIE